MIKHFEYTYIYITLGYFRHESQLTFLTCAHLITLRNRHIHTYALVHVYYRNEPGGDYYNFQLSSKVCKIIYLVTIIATCVCIYLHMQAWRYAFTTLTTVVATVIVEKLKAREKHLLNFSFS